MAQRHCIQYIVRGLPRKTWAFSIESIPTCSQWLVKTKYKMYFLIGLLALQMATNYFASLLISSPDGFQVLFLYLWYMYNTDWGNNDLTFKVMKKKGSHRDIKASKRQVQVKQEKEKRKREKKTVTFVFHYAYQLNRKKKIDILIQFSLFSPNKWWSKNEIEWHKVLLSVDKDFKDLCKWFFTSIPLWHWFAVIKGVTGRSFMYYET